MTVIKKIFIVIAAFSSPPRPRAGQQGPQPLLLAPLPDRRGALQQLHQADRHPINRIEAGEDALIERIRNEGERSPADVLITVDAGRLWRAEQLGFFQPVKSALLDARIPASLREPGGLWFGFSLRARLIAYNKAKVKAAELPTYESLAEPKWKGRICMRSSTNMYNLSLMGAMIDHLGEAEGARQWAQAVRDNLAREPKGGDTDQLKSVAAGECDVTISNQYYYARLLRSGKPDEREIAREGRRACSRTRRAGARTSTSRARA